MQTTNECLFEAEPLDADECRSLYIKNERRSIISQLDSSGSYFVNAHINNISFPKTIEELEFFVLEHGCFHVEEIISTTENYWTVPSASNLGDVVLFYHAKTAISRISALETAVKKLPDDSKHDKAELLSWLQRARAIYKQFGGKIFAVARITGTPEYWTDEEDYAGYHWRGRIYADIGDMVTLEHPIDISEFNDMIKVSRQSAITPLPANEFNYLRDIIWGKNDNLPNYFFECEIGNFKLSHLTVDNFLSATKPYRRRFLLESYFRSYYVDFLLKAIVGREYYAECTCSQANHPDCYVDNVFRYKGRYYLLEVKRNIQLEKNLVAQLHQYTNADVLFIGKQKSRPISDFVKSFMYVIDTNALYKFDTSTGTIEELIALDNVNTPNDIEKVLKTTEVPMNADYQ